MKKLLLITPLFVSSFILDANAVTHPHMNPADFMATAMHARAKEVGRRASLDIISPRTAGVAGDSSEGSSTGRRRPHSVLRESKGPSPADLMAAAMKEGLRLNGGAVPVASPRERIESRLEVSIKGVAAIRAGLDPMDKLIQDSIETLRTYIRLRDDRRNPLAKYLKHTALDAFKMETLENIEIGFLKGSQETFENYYRAAQYGRVDRLLSDTSIDFAKAEAARKKYAGKAVQSKSFAATVTRTNLMSAMKLACQLMNDNILLAKKQAKLQKRRKSRQYLGQVVQLQRRMEGVLRFYEEKLKPAATQEYMNRRLAAAVKNNGLHKRYLERVGKHRDLRHLLADASDITSSESSDITRSEEVEKESKGKERLSSSDAGR